MKITSLLRTILLVTGVIVITFSSSCTKQDIGAPTSANNSSEIERGKKLKKAVTKVLRDFTEANANGSNVSVGAGGGSNTFSNPATNVTTYSTPNANVYQWSDPTTGTVFTFSESTGGSGFGQLGINNKSFDYNYILTIKASQNDPTWEGFFDGRDLRGVVAIDGELTDTDFELNSIAFFFVATDGGTGTYEFIDFGSNNVSNSDAIGELIDLSSLQGATLSNLADDGKIYISSGGRIIVSESAFEMASDAKMMDVMTQVEYTIEGSIMTE